MGLVLTTLHCWLAQLFVQLSCKLFNLLVNHSACLLTIQATCKELYQRWPNSLQASLPVHKPAAYLHSG